MARIEGECIYRKVAVRMWGDAKVRSLTAPQPCGQTLWLHLIAGEQTGIIPGLFRIGEAAFAEQLGWSLDGFRAAWAEVAQQGMAYADWNARLVWVPRALRHNIPACPNVIIGWRDAWDLLPECDLKTKAKASVKAFLKAYSEPYAKAFEKVCEKPSPKLQRKDEAKASPNQEQEAVSSKQEDVVVAKSGESERRDIHNVDNSHDSPLKTGGVDNSTAPLATDFDAALAAVRKRAGGEA